MEQNTCHLVRLSPSERPKNEICNRTRPLLAIVSERLGPSMEQKNVSSPRNDATPLEPLPRQIPIADSAHLSSVIDA